MDFLYKQPAGGVGGFLLAWISMDQSIPNTIIRKLAIGAGQCFSMISFDFT